MTSAIESSAIAPAAFVVETIASPDAIPVDNNAAAPLEQASEQASNALDQPVASTETASESKAPEESQAASNEPALVDANAAEPADANEKALDHLDAKLIETEKADLAAASHEPAPAASILTSIIQAREVALRTISSLLHANISAFLSSEVLAITCFLQRKLEREGLYFFIEACS